MQLVMYVDETQVDVFPVFSGNIQLSKLMNELKEKHRDLLKNDKNCRFVLEHVPSQLNDFKPLKR